MDRKKELIKILDYIHLLIQYNLNITLEEFSKSIGWKEFERCVNISWRAHNYMRNCEEIEVKSYLKRNY